MRGAYYKSTIGDFLKEASDSIVGKLNVNYSESFAQQWTRGTTSWVRSIELFKQSFEEIIERNPSASNWFILLEYEIPRLLKRVDAIILAEDLIFVVEYKDDSKKVELWQLRQVEDYALDLKDFHFASRGRTIIPVLLAPFAKASLELLENQDDSDFIKPILKVNLQTFSHSILSAFNIYHNEKAESINQQDWIESRYSPTPTIIQAAQALFAGHQVEAITKSGAEAKNIEKTTQYLVEAINDAKRNNRKIVCFVTGVPGAGKTLVGLNIIHKKDFDEGHNASAAYFSGNGPLIKVLREALARDKKLRDKISKSEASHFIESKIQNLHQFIKDGILKEKDSKKAGKTVYERIVVFDEAQRCWDKNHFFNQTKRNENRQSEDNKFDAVRKSEAEILFEIMDKFEDWAVIVALVGGGQEINTGEAGIREWGNVLGEKFNHWEVHISPELYHGDSSTSGQKLFEQKPSHIKVHTDESLHLAISQRSFKANNLNEWVNTMLDNDFETASEVLKSIIQKYPIYVTRDLNKAKAWLKSFKRGTKRIGLAASSGAVRLRPFGITVKEAVDEPYWFLNPEDDIRSSDFLEIAITEFGIQGLEIDWIGICWDADLRRENDQWVFKNFIGDKWVKGEKDQYFILNTYRVLLTRAREGMVIWVPKGNKEDHTRLPEFYDPTFEYLKSCGLKEI